MTSPTSISKLKSGVGYWMEHHQDNDVSARASNKLPNEQLGLWVIQMHYWELQPVVNQSRRRKMSGNSEPPFYPWVFLLITEAEAPSSLPAQDQCPELSFLLRFQWASYPVQSRIFKHLKSRRQIKPPSILVIWEQNGVLFMIFVPRLCFPSAAAPPVLFCSSTFTINIIIILFPR